MRNATTLRPIGLSNRSEEELLRWQEHRERWMAKLDSSAHFHRMFDYVPGVHFFAKDRDGHLMFASKGLRARYAMKDDSEILGRTDFDINPDLMAQAYVADDLRLLNGETDIVERLELWWDAQSMPDWFTVTKLPLYDRNRKIQGVMGLIRRPDEIDRQLPVFQTVARAVEMIRRDFSQPLTIESVARACGQSVRQLQRRFQTAFGMSPQEFLMKTRILSAQRLLEQTQLSISEISTQCGFVDPSGFIRHFRKWLKVTPAAYRKHRNDV